MTMGVYKKLGWRIFLTSRIFETISRILLHFNLAYMYEVREVFLTLQVQVANPITFHVRFLHIFFTFPAGAFKPLRRCQGHPFRVRAESRVLLHSLQTPAKVFLSLGIFQTYSHVNSSTCGADLHRIHGDGLQTEIL